MLIIFIFTFIVFLINQSRPILSTSLFFDDVYQYNEGNLRDWYRIYTHPMTMRFFTLEKGVDEDPFAKKFD